MTLIHPWAVLAAAITAYLIGWAWYSPILWLKPWLESRGTAQGALKTVPKSVMLYGFVNTLVVAFVIAVFLALVGAETLLASVQVALLLCFGFVATVKFNELLYTAYPPHWGRRAQLLFIIDTGYWVVVFIVVAAIIYWLS